MWSCNQPWGYNAWYAVTYRTRHHLIAPAYSVYAAYLSIPAKWFWNCRRLNRFLVFSVVGCCFFFFLPTSDFTDCEFSSHLFFIIIDDDHGWRHAIALLKSVVKSKLFSREEVTAVCEPYPVSRAANSYITNTHTALMWVEYLHQCLFKPPIVTVPTKLIVS